MEQLNSVEDGGKEPATERTDKGKGVVPGSCPQICREENLDNLIIEQGDNSLGNPESQMRPVGKDKEEAGPSSGVSEVESQTQKGTVEDNPKLSQNQESTEEDSKKSRITVPPYDSELHPTEEGNQEKSDRDNHDQRGIMEEISKTGIEVEEYFNASEIMPSVVYEKEEKGKDTDIEILPLVVYEKTEELHGRFPTVTEIDNLQKVTDEVKKPSQKPAEAKQLDEGVTPLHKVDSGSNLKELITDSEGETTMAEQKEFPRMAEGKEGKAETRLKTLTLGKKYSASGSKSRAIVDSKMTLRQTGARTGTRHLSKGLSLYIGILGESSGKENYIDLKK